MTYKGKKKRQTKKNPQKTKQLRNPQYNLQGRVRVMKQQPCYLGVKVSAATANSLLLKTDSSPRERASKTCHTFNHTLMYYWHIWHIPLLLMNVFPQNMVKITGRCVQLQTSWEPQPSMPRAVGYDLGAHQPVSMGQAGHVGAAWCTQCHLHIFPSTCGPGVARDGFIWGWLMLRDFGGKGTGRWVSALLLPFPTYCLPSSFLVSLCPGGKYLIPGQNCLSSGTILLSFTFGNLRTQTGRRSNQHWNFAAVSYTSESSPPAFDISKASQQSQYTCFSVRKYGAVNLKEENISHIFAINIQPAPKHYLAKPCSHFEICSYTSLDAMTLTFSKACFWLCLHECE